MLQQCEKGASINIHPRIVAVFNLFSLGDKRHPQDIFSEDRFSVSTINECMKTFNLGIFSAIRNHCTNTCHLVFNVISQVRLYDSASSVDAMKTQFWKKGMISCVFCRRLPSIQLFVDFTKYEPSFRHIDFVRSEAYHSMIEVRDYLDPVWCSF